MIGRLKAFIYFLARWLERIPLIPTSRAVAVLLLGIPFALAPVWLGPKGVAVWLCYGVVMGLIFLVSPFLVWKLRGLEVELESPEIYYLESVDPVVLALRSDLPFALPVEVRLEVDGEAEVDGKNHPLLLEPGENQFSFEVRPLRRGEIYFVRAVVRVVEYFGLWKVECRYPLEVEGKMLPNLRAVGRYALRLYSDPDMKAGLKIEKYRGQGSEFESLREYMPGFDIRSIDWKVSARKGKMVSREYRAEKNHDIILAVDGGNLMAAEFDGLTKLDYAINGALILTYMAIKSGDRVGLLAFDSKVRSFIRPQANLQAVEHISKECAKLSYQFEPSNFVVSMEYLMAQQKRRALVIVFTDFVDSISVDLLKEYLFLVSRRHLVLFVAVRDPYLDQLIESAPRSLLEVHSQVACYSLRDERTLVFQELQRLGIHCLDLFPNQISAPILDKYLEIRRREMI